MVIDSVAMTIGASHPGAQVDVFIMNPTLLNPRVIDHAIAVTLITSIAGGFADQIHEHGPVRSKTAAIVSHLWQLCFDGFILNVATVFDPRHLSIHAAKTQPSGSRPSEILFLDLIATLVEIVRTRFGVTDHAVDVQRSREGPTAGRFLFALLCATFF